VNGFLFRHRISASGEIFQLIYQGSEEEYPRRVALYVEVPQRKAGSIRNPKTDIKEVH